MVIVCDESDTLCIKLKLNSFKLYKHETAHCLYNVTDGKKPYESNHFQKMNFKCHLISNYDKMIIMNWKIKKNGHGLSQGITWHMPGYSEECNNDD
jgi:hypothetical protein